MFWLKETVGLWIYFRLIEPVKRYLSRSFTILSPKIKEAFLYLKRERNFCWLCCCFFCLFSSTSLGSFWFAGIFSAMLAALVKISSAYVIISGWFEPHYLHDSRKCSQSLHHLIFYPYCYNVSPCFLHCNFYS